MDTHCGAHTTPDEPTQRSKPVRIRPSCAYTRTDGTRNTGRHGGVDAARAAHRAQHIVAGVLYHDRAIRARHTRHRRVRRQPHAGAIRTEWACGADCGRTHRIKARGAGNDVASHSPQLLEVHHAVGRIGTGQLAPGNGLPQTKLGVRRRVRRPRQQVPTSLIARATCFQTNERRRTRCTLRRAPIRKADVEHIHSGGIYALGCRDGIPAKQTHIHSIQSYHVLVKNLKQHTYTPTRIRTTIQKEKEIIGQARPHVASFD
jgi:hypothetical protein